MDSTSGLAAYFSKMRAERFFLVISVLFGSLFLYLTPPYQIPDEPCHFYRAYQVSQGIGIAMRLDNRVGGILPESLQTLADVYYPVIVNASYKMEDSTLAFAKNIALDEENRVFLDFNNTVVYSAVCYLPQAAAIFFLRQLNIKPYYMVCVARIFALIFWIMIVYIAIRICPVYKWLLALIALLPMSLFINMSLSADMVTNGLAFLFIAFVLLLRAQASKMSLGQLFCLLLLAILICCVKTAYVLLVLLIFCIPKSSFGNTRQYIMKSGLLILASVITAFAWSSVCKKMYLSYDEYKPGVRDYLALVKGADVARQLEFVANNAGWVLSIFKETLLKNGNDYLQSFIGNFGWLNSPLPHWVVLLNYLVILITAFLNGKTEKPFGVITRVVLLLILLGSLYVVLLSQYLNWVPVGGGYSTLQGRYLIPVAPLLFMLFQNQYSNKKILVPLVIATVLCSLTVSCFVLWERFF